MTLKETIEYLKSMLTEYSGDTPIYIIDFIEEDADVVELGPEHIVFQELADGSEGIVISTLDEE